MIYLSGMIRTHLVGLRPDLGVMDNPATGNVYDRALGPWAIENECYAKGDDFDLDAYLGRLERLRAWRATCLFAPAPDVVADAAATWERSRHVLPIIRRMGYPAAFVAQDDLEHLPIQWDTFDVLFLGGTTEWKLGPSAYDIAIQARQRGKRLHMGRVNSRRRYRTAAHWKCNSADGTYLAFGPDRNTPTLLAWLDERLRCPELSL